MEYTMELVDAAYDYAQETYEADDYAALLDFLNSSNFRTFGEALESIIRKKMPADCALSPKEFLQNRCKETGITVASASTLRNWFSGSPRPKKDDKSREDMFWAAIMGGGAQGLTGIMLRIGGSAGGVDVIACMIQRRKQSGNVERIIAILSYMIAAFSFFIWGDVNAVIFSFIAIFVCEKITAVVLNDSRSAVKFEIIVNKNNAQEIKDLIVYEMKRGATVIDARGVFLNEEKEIILCLVHYRQLASFLEKLSNYPDLFVSYSEVLGIRGNFDWILGYEKTTDITMRENRLEVIRNEAEF